MSSESQNGWNEWSKFVLEQLKTLSAKLDSLETSTNKFLYADEEIKKISLRLQKLDTEFTNSRIESVKELTALKVKMALIGAVSSIVIAGLVNLIAGFVK